VAIAVLVMAAIMVIPPRQLPTESPPAPAGDPAIALPDVQPIIHVRIGKLNRRSPLELTGFGGTLTFLAGTSKVMVAAAGVIRVSATGGVWEIAAPTGMTQLESAGERLEITWDGPSPGVGQSDGAPPRRYPGGLRLVARDQIQVINVLPIEAYLPGVLAREMPTTWESAALEAQAIAARSYACYQIFHRGKDAIWHVGDTPRYQVYHGNTGADEPHQAVAATFGVVLSWNESLVPGWYSSCCGGFPASAADVFSPSPVTLMPPLQGHGGKVWCMKSPRWQWEIDRPASTLSRRLATGFDGGGGSGHGSGVASITIATRSDHHRPTTLSVRLESGETATIGATRLRRLANSTPPGLDPPHQGLYSSNLTGRQRDGVVQIKGQGWGHGVGLCQWGAQAQAKAGRDAETIIEFYYPQATLHRAW
jgi:stage II sporulation protein D